MRVRRRGRPRGLWWPLTRRPGVPRLGVKSALFELRGQVREPFAKGARQALVGSPYRQVHVSAPVHQPHFHPALSMSQFEPDVVRCRLGLGRFGNRGRSGPLGTGRPFSRMGRFAFLGGSRSRRWNHLIYARRRGRWLSPGGYRGLRPALRGGWRPPVAQ